MRIIMHFELSGDAVRKIAIWGLVQFVAIPFGCYYGMAYWGSGIAGAVVGFLIGAVLTLFGMYLVSGTAGFFGAVVGERKASYSKREQFDSDMQQDRYHKVNKDYDQALRKVNEILMTDASYTEALFLKAQIVWEGYGNRASALSNLKKIQDIETDKSSTIWRWAASLMEEINVKS